MKVYNHAKETIRFELGGGTSTNKVAPRSHKFEIPAGGSDEIPDQFEYILDEKTGMGLPLKREPPAGAAPLRK